MYKIDKTNCGMCDADSGHACDSARAEFPGLFPYGDHRPRADHTKVEWDAYIARVKHFRNLTKKMCVVVGEERTAICRNCLADMADAVSI